MRPEALAQHYSSKTDDELLLLAASPDTLIEEARPILAEELGRRGLTPPPTHQEVDTPASNFRNTAIFKFFRTLGAYLLNLALAMIGTTTLESQIWSLLGRPHSVSAIVLREWLLGPPLAAFLGFSVARRWRSKTALWVWILPVVLFFFKAFSNRMSGADVFQHMFGPNDPGDRSLWIDFITFTLPAIRTVSYSLAAWITLNLRKRPDEVVVPTPDLGAASD